MLLVVMSHVGAFGLGIRSCHEGISTLITKIHLPLFFFVSGFFAYRANEVFDWKQYWSNLTQKTKTLLIPLLFFGLLFAITVVSHRRNIPPANAILTLLNAPSKLGYWFTEVLLESFIIYYTISLLMRKQKLLHRQIVLVVVASCFFALSLLGSSTFYKYNVLNWLCIYHLLLYFQFFIFGNLASCYRNKFFKTIENQYVIGTLVLLFSGLYIVYLHIYGIAGNIVLQNATKIVVEAISILGVIVVVAVFRHYEHFFSTETRIGRGLQNIGQRTLDVYLIHYFLIPCLPAVGLFFNQTSNIVLETTTILALSLLVIVFCLIISSIIRVSPFLAHWLLGVKREK